MTALSDHGKQQREELIDAVTGAIVDTCDLLASKSARVVVEMLEKRGAVRFPYVKPDARVEDLAMMLRRMIRRAEKQIGYTSMKALAEKARQLLTSSGLNGDILRDDAMPQQANPTSFVDGFRGFAAMIRSGAMTPDDHDMVAKKFDAAATVLDERDALLVRMAEALSKAANALEFVAELTWDKRQPDATRRACDEASSFASDECDQAREALAEYEATKAPLP